MKREDIEKLAALSRIDISEQETEELLSEMEAILGYVSEIQEATTGAGALEVGALCNVMREDEDPHTQGAYTKEILDEVPQTQDGYVKVKQIL
ncbi:MAG: Asp-tRNA(Asn)/Glu-tRNA(Gln) amidotransferase subunit GatC [Patescibacteria group bacterium]|nr:Asp-tRNA(Asn)/Glu-tRNA(Gln) amidotransferase subunit GatC [Patescibacteria group bacterium]